MSHGRTRQSTGRFSGSKKERHQNRDAGDRQKKKDSPSWIQLPKRK
jgi:hypothetical protein